MVRMTYCGGLVTSLPLLRNWPDGRRLPAGVQDTILPHTYVECRCIFRTSIGYRQSLGLSQAAEHRLKCLTLQNQF